MADIQRTIAATLRISQEGDAEVFGETAEQVEALDKAIGGANRAFDAIGKASEAANRAIEQGSPRAEAAVKKLYVAVEQGKVAIEAAQRAGAPVTPQQLQLVEKAEAEYKNLAAAAGRISVAGQQAKRDLDDASEAAGGVAPRISGLDDVMRELAENLGAGAVKWLSWGTAAAGAFTAGYAAGTKFRAVLNEISDGGWDRLIERVFHLQAAADQLALKLANLGRGSVDLSKALDFTADQANYLRQQGFDPVGLSAVEVARKFAEVSTELARQEISWKKFRAAVGVVGKDLDKLAEDLIRNIQLLAKEHPEIPLDDLIKKFRPQVEELVGLYGHLETEGRKKLQGLLTAWQNFSGGVQQEALASTAAVDKFVQSLTGADFSTFQNKLHGIETAFSEVAAALQLPGLISPAFATVFQQIADTISAATAGVDKFAQSAEAAAKSTHSYYDEAVRLQQILEGVGNTADDTAGKIAGVFLGTPQIAGADVNQVGYDPLHIDS